MLDQVNATPTPHKRLPWNKGKLTGAKPPLRPKHVWSIRTKLQIEGRARDLAMFNLAIDSKLRGCDVVAIRVEDVAAGGARASTGLPCWSRACCGRIQCSSLILASSLLKKSVRSLALRSYKPASSITTCAIPVLTGQRHRSRHARQIPG